MKEIYRIKSPIKNRYLKVIKTGLNQHPINNLVEVQIADGSFEGLKFFINREILQPIN